HSFAHLSLSTLCFDLHFSFSFPFSSSLSRHLRSLHSFPTRRSSDLAGYPNAFPISTDNVPMYVPFEQVTFIRNGLVISPFECRCSILYIITFRSGRSISMFSRAYSYNFFPFTLIAEYIGGICIISPVNDASTCLISSSVGTESNVFSSTVSPSASSVVVLLPKNTSAIYCLCKGNKNEIIFVASPTQIGNTPSTEGSNVPV